jgi:sec-independent protein translocase protein TatA
MELFAPGHLLVVLAIAILVFGPKKLPELGRGLGEAIRGFKGSLNATDEPAAPAGKTDTVKSDSARSDQPK